MANTDLIQKARQNKRRALDAVYRVLILDEPKIITDGDLADLVRIPKTDIRNLRADLVETRSLRVEKADRAAHGYATRVNSWTLLDPQPVATRKLDELWTQQDQRTAERMHDSMVEVGRRKNGKTSTTPAPYSELVHVSGDDAPKPLAALSKERYDEPRALVEAARQFANLHREVDRRLQELEGLGIQINRDQIAKTIQLPRDPRLAAVAEALPYIEQLERTAERLGNQVADLRQKLGNQPELQQRLNRLQGQNERLIGEKVALEARLRERPDARPSVARTNGTIAEQIPLGK